VPYRTDLPNHMVKMHNRMVTPSSTQPADRDPAEAAESGASAAPGSGATGMITGIVTGPGTGPPYYVAD
jgi:hypothetical protein